MKIIGYGICGEGEADRYMRQTLDCFKNLCDEVIILCNNAGKDEFALIDSYGFRRSSDRREWGKWQWRIKQDFLERDVAPVAREGDMMICLDMDEALDKELTREWLLRAPLDAYHVFIVDLWEEGYKPESCFWNVRLWRWNGNTKFKQKPVHCGLAPEWAYHYHRHAPFILKHYGLKDKEDRLRKIRRYEQYDPRAEHLDRKYYDMLADDRYKPFDEDKIHETIAREVESYKQAKPREMLDQKKNPQRFAYVKNPHGQVVDIPERHLKETLKRSGFEFIGWADEAQKEIESLFEDVDVPGGADEAAEVLLDASKGSYQGSTEMQHRQFEEMNSRDNPGNIKYTAADLPSDKILRMPFKVSDFTTGEEPADSDSESLGESSDKNIKKTVKGKRKK